jgi:MoaA/NifB/PqqE/SkfB family radical SAM enzyme
MSPPTISKEEQEAKRLIMKNTFDVNKTPVIAIWETTEACGRACLDYGDWIQPEADPLELSTIEAKKMIDDVAELCPPIFVLTGADPLKRADIYPLIRYAASQHLHPVLALHSTPLLTRDAIADLKNAGLSRLVLSLDGASAELHDLICGVHGSFARTMEAIQWAAHWRLTFQITTHFSERNLHDLENIAALLKTLRISQWSVAFPVPSTPARLEEMPSADNLKELLPGFTRLRKGSRSRSRHQRRRTTADMSCSSRLAREPRDHWPRPSSKTEFPASCR